MEDPPPGSLVFNIAHVHIPIWSQPLTYPQPNHSLTTFLRDICDSRREASDEGPRFQGQGELVAQVHSFNLKPS